MGGRLESCDSEYGHVEVFVKFGINLWFPQDAGEKHRNAARVPIEGCPKSPTPWSCSPKPLEIRPIEAGIKTNCAWHSSATLSEVYRDFPQL
jgi:hypothetical protein